jgi:hypothetical protein
MVNDSAYARHPAKNSWIFAEVPMLSEWPRVLRQELRLEHSAVNESHESGRGFNWVSYEFNGKRKLSIIIAMNGAIWYRSECLLPPCKRCE